MKLMSLPVGLRFRTAVFAAAVILAPACSTPRPYTGTDTGSVAGGSGNAGASGSTGGGPGTGGVLAPGSGGTPGMESEAGHPGGGGSGFAGIPTASGGITGTGGVPMNPGGGPGSGGVAAGGMVGSGGTSPASGGIGGNVTGSGGITNGNGGQVLGSGGVRGSGGIPGSGGAGCSDTNTCASGTYCVNGNCLAQLTNNLACQTMAQCLSGNCSAGLCCAAGLTNCSATCVDLTSDDKHCGACTGETADCAMSGQATKHCRNSACRLVDGSPCSSDSDCMSAQCNLYYADSDQDGYPDHYNTQRFCTIPGSLSDGPYTTTYMPARTDGKWDCCDLYAPAHPDATVFASWQISVVLDQQCMGAFGDTNCNGQVTVDSSAVITTGCNSPDGVTCNHMTRTPTSADCGISECGCGAPSVGGFCSLYCAPGGPAVSCQ